MRSKRLGVTFIEILVAMIVFGILSAITVPRYRLYKERAYRSTLRTNLGEIRVAEEGFWAENQLYSANLSLLDWKPTSNVSITVSTTDPYAGFTAVATHALLTGEQCATYVGRNAVNIPSGEIVCGPVGTNASGVGQPTN